MKYIWLAVLIFTSCAGLKRSPSSIKNPDSLFNLINSEEILKSAYSFELVGLFALQEKRIIFKTYEIDAPDAKKAVDVWLADLNGFLSVYKEDFKVRVGTREVTVKITDLTRLQQALSLLNKSGESSDRILRKQTELVTAFNHNLRAPEAFNYASVPFEFSQASTKQPAFAESSFWRTPSRKQTLSPVEFSVPELATEDCKGEFVDASGFLQIVCGNLQFKLQRQDSPKVAAFNSILYRRLGYNAAPVIFVPAMNLSYDRSVLPVLKNLKVKFNAVLKSGEIVPFESIASKLLPYCNSRSESCFSSSALFDPATESQVEKLQLTDFSLNVEAGDHVFGSWSYDELDHPSRPEVKALLFVSAFTGNTDLRKESNAVVWSAKNFSVSHRIQNLNSGLGAIRPGSPMNLNGVKWEVLKTKNQRGAQVFVFDSYRPSVKRQAFSEITAEDAKWAIRQIAGLSEQELTEALALSGFSAAELLLTREKLLSVQKNFVETLGLSQEFSTVTSRKIEKNINYRLTGQPALLEITSSRRIEVPEGNDEIINGQLKKGQAPSFENKRKISNTVDE